MLGATKRPTDEVRSSSTRAFVGQVDTIPSSLSVFALSQELSFPLKLNSQNKMVSQFLVFIPSPVTVFSLVTCQIKATCHRLSKQ